jgi:Uma2 family endonuclease
MASIASHISRPPAFPDIPPLENGDHLQIDEFIRRYNVMPEGVKAELINGVVFMSPPVSVGHSFYHADIMGWLWFYSAHTPGVTVGDNGSIRLDRKNQPQPDATLLIENGGQTRITDDNLIEGGPELVAEVAGTSATIDLHHKLELYRRHRIREYIVWRFHDVAIDIFRLEGSDYVAAIPDAGIYKSIVFPGLWLDVNAMLKRDKPAVLRAVQQGLATPDHAAFVAKLAAAAKP